MVFDGAIPLWRSGAARRAGGTVTVALRILSVEIPHFFPVRTGAPGPLPDRNIGPFVAMTSPFPDAFADGAAPVNAWSWRG